MAVADVLDVKQCAELLGFSDEHIRVLAREEKIPAAKIGGRWRFSRRQVLEWLEIIAVPEGLVEKQMVYEADKRLEQNEGWHRLEDVTVEIES